MQLDISQAILHVLDTHVDEPVLSAACLNLSEENMQYLANHAIKCFLSDDTKACALADDSAVLPLLWNLEDSFVEKSCTLARDWFALMQKYPSIPAGDVIFMLLNIDGAEYFTALKMNYKTGYVHYFSNEDNIPYNDIVKQTAVLPGSGGKADEAFFIETKTHAARLIEKNYDIDGHKRTYLSGEFLGCKSGMSPKEKLNFIKEAAIEVNQKFYGNTGVDEPELAAAVCEQYRERDVKEPDFQVGAICDKLYSDMPHAKEAFTRALESHDIKLDEPLPISGAAVRRLEKQSLRSGDGVEIKVPINLYRNENALEFIRNADGTMSLLIKNMLM